MPSPQQQQQEPLKPATLPEAEPEPQPEHQPEALPEKEQQDTWTAPPEPEQEEEPAREPEVCSCCLFNNAHAAVLDRFRNLWWQACP